MANLFVESISEKEIIFSPIIKSLHSSPEFSFNYLLKKDHRLRLDLFPSTKGMILDRELSLLNIPVEIL